jgi:hypothetical protein
MADQAPSAEQLKAAARRAVQANDIDAARRLIEAAKAAESSRAPIRSAAQGLTFGFSDEAIAAATNPISALRSAFGDEAGGQGYSERLGRERGALEAYRRDYPIESAATEIGGAVVPAAAATLLSGGTAGPAATGSLVARALQAAPAMAKQGAIYGGLYGAGTAEGGPMERLQGTGVGAVTGAVLSPIVGGATYPLVAGAAQLTDAARRMFGGRGGKAVEAELQRLADGTGLSVDEIAQKVASGEILAENATLRMTTRALMSRGGRGETMVRETMDRRPPQKRAEAMAEIQQYLSTTTDPNVLRAQRMSQEAAKAGEKASYTQLFSQGGGGPAPAEVSVALSDVFERVPAAAKELSAFVRADTKTSPYFTVADDGAVTFNRPPTLQEAEITRRFIAGKKNEAYSQGSPWGETYKEIEGRLRAEIDTASPQLAQTRTKWANIMSERDAFDAGQKLFNRSADEVEILVEELLRKGPDGQAQLDALRGGAMDALRTKARGAAGTNLMATLTNPERKESAILRAILPPAVYDDVLQRAEVAAQSQAARSDIVKGPSTALTQAADRNLGTGVSADEAAAALSGNMVSMLKVGMQLAKQLAPQLSDQDRVRILGVLLSEDPQVVRRALSDQSGLAAFKQAVDRLVSTTATGARAGAVVGGTMAVDAALNDRGPR